MRILLLALAIILLPGAAWALEAQALVDRTSIGVNDTLSLSIILSGDGAKDAKVDITPMRDFLVLSQSASTNISIINGSMHRQVSYRYRLAPNKTGQLSIPAFPVHYEGQVIETAPVSITVAGQQSAPAAPGPNNARPQQGTRGTQQSQQQPESLEQNLFMKAEISNPAPYVGQPIVYKVSVFQSIRIEQPTFQEPPFAGFAVDPVDEGVSSPTQINGRRFNVTALRYALTPLEPGEKTLAPSTLDFVVLQPSGRPSNDPFDRFFNDPFFSGSPFGRFRRAAGQIHSEPVKMNVLPLPEYTGEQAFSGLVGRYTLSASMDKSTAKVGDSVTMTVTIEGAGNIKDAPPPKLGAPDGVKVYQDAPQEEISLTDQGYQGKKVFRFALVPSKPGQYSIPPLSLVFFDPQERRYRTVNTEAMALNATPVAEDEAGESTKVTVSPEAATTPTPTAQPQKQQVAYEERDILPLKEGLQALEREAPMSLSLIILLALAPPALFGAAWIFRRRTGRVLTPEKEQTLRAGQALKAAKEAQDPQEGVSQLRKALVAATCSRGACRRESLTYAEAADILRKGGASEDDTTAVCALMERLDTARYSGAGLLAAQLQELVQETEQAVRRVRK